VVVPELSWQAYQADKQRLKVVQGNQAARKIRRAPMPMDPVGSLDC
jgi:hypothetical protein